MTQHDNKPRPESLSGELDASHLRGRDDVAGYADNKQVSQTLIEDDLRRNPGIGTTEDDGKRLLISFQFKSPGRKRRAAITKTRGKPVVPFTQTFQRVDGRNDHSSVPQEPFPKNRRRASAISARAPAPERITSTDINDVWIWPRFER